MAGVSGLIEDSRPLFRPLLYGALSFPHHIHIRPRKVPSRVTRGPVALQVWQSPGHPQASECLDLLGDVRVVGKRTMVYVSLSWWESCSLLTFFIIRHHHYEG